MRYEDWEAGVPDQFKTDVLSRVKEYRLARFVADLAWHDATRLAKDRRAARIADQLFRSTTAIAPDLSEGYSRSSGKDQARFYEYALGSASESRDWYQSGRHVLSDAVTLHRIELLTEIMRLTTAMIPQRRGAPRITKRSNSLRITNYELPQS